MDDNKKSTTIWLRPSVISRMDGWLEADNCQSRSEFVDKALRFYMGYLGTEDNTTYISRAILTAIQGTLDDNNNRLCRILFKCAVELNMLCHTIAAHFRADPSVGVFLVQRIAALSVKHNMSSVSVLGGW